MYSCTMYVHLILLKSWQFLTKRFASFFRIIRILANIIRHKTVEAYIFIKEYVFVKDIFRAEA